ncbi:MAG: GspH/FimT family pseudopilin [Planctomycetota bacterium]|nr:GspH/FimT family pseudopilin [Planctomycetota bacterium]
MKLNKRRVFHQVADVSVASKRIGLTLVDITVTVLIVGILAAVTAPKFVSSVQFRQSRSAADRIARDLDLARQTARHRSASQAVQFNAAASTYTLPGVAALNRRPGDYSIDVSARPFNSTIVSVDLGGDSEIIFNGYGQPDSGGDIVVAVGSRQWTISVDPTSGMVTVQ